MATYRSRLKTVLEERSIRQDQRQRAHAVEKQQLLREETILQKMIEASETALNGMSALQEGFVNPGEIEVYWQFVDHQARKIAKQKEVVIAQRRMVEEKRQDLEKAVQEKKTIEKIEAKRKEVFFASVKKKESDFLDEVGGRMEQRGLG